MFKTASQFSLYVEQYATEKRMSHMEAILHYCEENFIEPDDIKHLVNKSLRDKIEMDLIKENMLPKRASLEIDDE